MSTDPKSNGFLECPSCARVQSAESRFCSYCGSNLLAGVQQNVSGESHSTNLQDQIDRFEQYLADVAASTGHSSSEFADALEQFSTFLNENKICLAEADRMMARAAEIRSQLKSARNAHIISQPQPITKPPSFSGLWILTGLGVVAVLLAFFLIDFRQVAKTGSFTASSEAGSTGQGSDDAVLNIGKDITYYAPIGAFVLRLEKEVRTKAGPGAIDITIYFVIRNDGNRPASPSGIPDGFFINTDDDRQFTLTATDYYGGTIQPGLRTETLSATFTIPMEQLCKHPVLHLRNSELVLDRGIPLWLGPGQQNVIDTTSVVKKAAQSPTVSDSATSSSNEPTSPNVQNDGTDPVARPIAAPTPVAHASAMPSPSPVPSPVGMAHAGGPTAFSPSPKTGGSSFSAFAPSAAPSPISVGSGGGSSGHPGPVPVLGGDGVNNMSDANTNPNKGLSGGTDSGTDFKPYMSDVNSRIKRVWFPPKGCESKRVIVAFKIHRGGDISDLHIDQSSGVPTADQAALRAVEAAAPFQPLPAAASEEPDIQFTFDYNVFGGGGHGIFRQF